MIIDKIENIEKYSQIPISVIKFIKNLTPETPVGHYELENEIFANIDEYTTKLFEDCKFEAHKKYIDIQILTTGTEQLDYINIEGLAVSKNTTKIEMLCFLKILQLFLIALFWEITSLHLYIPMRHTNHKWQ